MIENLPKQIEIKQLAKFNFGDIEANDDELLFDSVCKTSSILEFVTGKKNIVLGEKGTGKTALFRLIRENKLKFQPKNGYKDIIIPVEDNFQYKNVKSKLLKLIQTDDEDEIFKFQVVWEIFLFRKIATKLNQLDHVLPRDIKEGIELAGKVFNDQGFENLIRSKKTLGVKLYDTPTSILPDFYISSEPVVSEERIREESMERLELDLDKYKTAINQYLIKNQFNVIIIIDRLDEFVSKSSIPIQLQMLEALIAVEREYNRHSNIELKIFLRDDLFKQLSFEGIGYDKVISKKVDLAWTPDKIREFIAKRIYLNYKQIFNLDHLTLHVDQETLEIDTSIDSDSYVRPIFCVRWYRALIKKINPQHYAQKFPRKVNLNDKLNRQIILSIFPRYVEFKNEEGKLIEVDIFDYFANNFNLGTGNTIPRLILIFLKKWLAITTNYYMENPDQMPVKRNEQGCFELVRSGFFERAFEEFKNEIHLNFAKLNPEFESQIKLFKERIGYRYTFRAKELKGLLGITEDEDLYHFCNYLLHIGYLQRTNSTTTIENMKFELPHMFRNIK
ncbi:hypothetical protein SAMN05216474_0772 [Lishizhenia tianjinensis]|uniref:Uncharacterized protein n=1 Tax=Lishizhenia tianjinensis TaxID=477690 RepID=A0A1I6YAU1_9FLAO|nr:hypothetical protein [Lishizhenia tianjinensis]SFT47646.1 hypothetical protein SAMN05216474_0772 [Lishizhenia tianjinensis]